MTKNIFTIRKNERWMVIAVAMILGMFHLLIIAKYFPLFAHYGEQQWDVFMRNFHMSGFDPTGYAVLTHWHQGYDVVRHPLLALMQLPLYGLNRLLWWITGCNCCQIVMGALLLMAGTTAWLMLFRTLNEHLALPRRHALLLSALTFGFAYVLLATFVPDHFGLSLALLTTLLYIAGGKLRHGQAFTSIEAALWFLVTAGVTLSNGVTVFLMVWVVNGHGVWRPSRLWRMFVMPALLLLAVVVVVGLTADPVERAVSSPIDKQLGWVRGDVSRLDATVENFLGESLQLHRRHILGDVLTQRPVIVRYTWPVQYVVEGVIMAMFFMGVWMGRRDRLLWMVLAVMAFNVTLHVVIGFAIDEVYIMAAHWAWGLPVGMAYVWHDNHRALRLTATLLVIVIAAYLWTYHSVLLYRYLTWPVKM
jgi:hypothetical protein